MRPGVRSRACPHRSLALARRTGRGLPSRGSSKTRCTTRWGRVCSWRRQATPGSWWERWRSRRTLPKWTCPDSPPHTTSLRMMTSPNRPPRPMELLRSPPPRGTPPPPPPPTMGGSTPRAHNSLGMRRRRQWTPPPLPMSHLLPPRHLILLPLALACPWHFASPCSALTRHTPGSRRTFSNTPSQPFQARTSPFSPCPPRLQSYPWPSLP
mmetsp:Transcript_7698/g.19054  ORF Transcript_7698/g.19054 Transcript_7698/m.19054 type:complete len:210 (-) Transcript_7698:2510-3139(-)